MRICVRGTGTTGSAIAASLCRAGFATTVWARTVPHIASAG